MCQRNRLCDFWLRLSQAVSIFASKCRFLLHLDPETPQSRLSGNRRGSGVARIFRPCYTAVIYIEMIFQRIFYKVLITFKSNPYLLHLLSVLQHCLQFSFFHSFGYAFHTTFCTTFSKSFLASLESSLQQTFFTCAFLGRIL